MNLVKIRMQTKQSFHTSDMGVSLSSTVKGFGSQNSATQIYQSSHPDLHPLPKMSACKIQPKPDQQENFRAYNKNVCSFLPARR